MTFVERLMLLALRLLMVDEVMDLVIVDDDELTLELVKRRLKNTPHRLICFSDPNTALSHLRLNHVDVLLVDQRMPQLDGIDLLRELGDCVPGRAYLCSSVPLPQELVVEAQQYGATSILKDVLGDQNQLVELIS